MESKLFNSYDIIGKSQSIEKVKNLISETRKAILEGNKEKAQEYGKQAVSALDKARQKNALHSNNTARKKSRLLRQINHLLKSE